MSDTVFVNGRAVIHKGSGGQATAFPDVCLCPPGPPAGPVPTPLTNSVRASDLAQGTRTVQVDGQPAATRASVFARSSGNEVSRPTGGGISNAAVMGQGRFQFSHSFNVFFEGEPVVRHLDLVQQNCQGPVPNTPPAPWLSSLDPSLPCPPAQRLEVQREDGDEWIVIRILNEVGEPAAGSAFRLEVPGGGKVEGRLLAKATLEVRGLAKGPCRLVLADVDRTCAAIGRSEAARARSPQVAYRPGAALALACGKEHQVVAPALVSFWIDLPIRIRDAAVRDDRFTLRSHDGGYEVVRTVGDDRVRGDRGLTLEFPDVRPGLSYTLLHDMGADGGVRAFFADVPFEELFPSVPPEEPDLPELRDIGAMPGELVGVAVEDVDPDLELDDLPMPLEE